ncbi:molybdopterin dehydrogenase FAD-binding protein [Pseudonocardia dioxanivorans CB1190]|uniref:Molybdopterin dehydrogenase FAD-binding protein n=1 Tax=Pseudonocardia dioxanivorans (strain ATCC 55486 / DSM 44775 / JCM 13855 / CB1190) TaxID=675635 RepID=F4CML4_PSEUX|nr:FAD binding domain-containing protein [Pseudonocardia dioxanivorans]AEA23998.1 molybdopterin dehydrogenase FAD-binding protein [Pseudonocardia dioxanivorans CB1190]GJF05198.1 carbon-monoxide dehydrogenase medium subunit [Pseudonocardia sp. D17]
MDFLAPSTWAEALAAKAERPDALPVAGGTDVMVELNFDHRRPDALLDLTRVPELREWAWDDGRIRLGAGVTYARVIAELGDRLPGLAMAARTVGSPQIRNRGTVGGNLGAASPAGDSHPALLAADAVVEIASAARGTREVPVAEFFTGVKRNALAPDELIAAVLVAPPAGPQQFCKIGTRNAMVIAVSAFGFALHPDRKEVGTGVGSAAPTPRRADAAAAFLAGELEAAGLWESRAALPDGLAAEFGRRVRDAAAPIDDVRGTAAYRLHTLSVMARRAATWAWDEHRRAA